MSRVVVGMSGGVDSSLAAALMLESYNDVIGITMHLAGNSSRCCSLDDADDARKVAEQLGINFYVANYTKEFRQEVMKPFADSYLAGETPIPCIVCNKRFKFDHLLARARGLGAEKVATGHYARIAKEEESGEFRLLRALDSTKDQSYFLYNLSQDQLARIEFPLGFLTKEEVRQKARNLGLSTAEKPESQEICFVPDGDYAKVVEELEPSSLPGRGEVVSEDGTFLGSHEGIHHFTVGQRRGLGVSGSGRLYVSKLDAKLNRVVVGDGRSLEHTKVEGSNLSWVSNEGIPDTFCAEIRVRHGHDPCPAKVEVLDGVATAFLDRPVRAVAAGQAAVFYDSDTVLGGGSIKAAN